MTDACGGRAISHLATLTVASSPTADAGGPYETCETTSVAVTGLAANTTGVSWQSDGTGTFADADSLTTEYTPSIDDVAAGSVTIKLTAQPAAPCTHAAIATTTLIVRKNPTADAGGPYVVCADSPGVAITGTAADHSAVAWSSAGDGTFTDPANLITSYAPGPADLVAGSVTLTLTAFPAAPCTTSATAIASLSITAAPLGNPGGPYVTCNTTPVPLTGAISNAASAHWSSSGTGVFDDANILDATYTPSTEDVAAGSVQLTLTANPVGPCTASTTANVTLEIHTNPQILIQPTSPAIGVGSDFTLSVSATGGGLTYQWIRDSFPIEGATDANYVIEAAELADTGTYTCVVSNECGSITTNPTNLVVNHHATLALGLPSACSSGEQLVVSINVSAATSVVVGGQFFLAYDTNILQLASTNSGDAPFLRQNLRRDQPHARHDRLRRRHQRRRTRNDGARHHGPLHLQHPGRSLHTHAQPRLLAAERPGRRHHQAKQRLGRAGLRDDRRTLRPFASTVCGRSSPPARPISPCTAPPRFPRPRPSPRVTTATASSSPHRPSPPSPAPARTPTRSRAPGPPPMPAETSRPAAQLIAVNDTIAPVIGSPPSIAAVFASQAAAENAAKAAALMAADDNCTGQLTASASTIGDCTATITVTVADGCGNVSNSVQFETQIDESAPALVACPTNILTNVNSSNCTASSRGLLPLPATTAWNPP